MYTIEKASLISDQLKRFTTAYAHHVVGQFANIDFWLQEVQASLKTIDEYNERFDKIRDRQQEWVDFHGTVVQEYCRICRGKCEFGNDGPPAPPSRMSSNELRACRRELIDSVYYFLIRCYRMELLEEQELRIKCKELGTSIELSDLDG